MACAPSLYHTRSAKIFSLAFTIEFMTTQTLIFIRRYIIDIYLLRSNIYVECVGQFQVEARDLKDQTKLNLITFYIYIHVHYYILYIFMKQKNITNNKPGPGFDCIFFLCLLIRDSAY